MTHWKKIEYYATHHYISKRGEKTLTHHSRSRKSLDSGGHPSGACTLRTQDVQGESVSITQCEKEGDVLT